MSVTGVQSQAYTNVNGSSSTDMGGTREVDKQEFLQLLVAQLRNQDPMKPMEDREFITQLAQFNSLEQMQAINRTLTQTSEMTVLGQMAGFVGKQVEAMSSDGTGVVTGIVSGVTLIEGSAVLTVGDKQVDVRNVYSIADPPPAKDEEDTTATTPAASQPTTPPMTEPETETPATQS